MTTSKRRHNRTTQNTGCRTAQRATEEARRRATEHRLWPLG
jgi:hypothetical protein